MNFDISLKAISKLANKDDELSILLAKTRMQELLDEYQCRFKHLDGYQSSQLCRTLILLLDK